MFPFSESLVLEQGFRMKAGEVVHHLAPVVTPQRLAKIEKVVDGRCFENVFVLENIYDRGNISAVLRSLEGMGFGQVHLIESEKFKESQRTTAGADKWVEIQRWKETRVCLQELKRQGKQIVVTHLSDKSVPVQTIDFSKPTAFVLGNEKDGVSPEMIAAADACVVLPMSGFVQSFNISVAAALGAWHIRADRENRRGQHGDLSDQQKQILKALYLLRTLDSGVQTLKEICARQVAQKGSGQNG